MAIKARMYVSTIVKNAVPGMRVTLQAVTRGPENKEWAAATPYGQVEMTIQNEPAAKWFEDRLGKDVLVSFDATEDDEPHTSPYA
jgi:hypothetical protein